MKYVQGGKHRFDRLSRPTQPNNFVCALPSLPKVLAWGLEHEAVPARKLAIKCCAAWFTIAAPVVVNDPAADDADGDDVPLLQQMVGSLLSMAREDRHSSVRSQALDCLGAPEVLHVHYVSSCSTSARARSTHMCARAHTLTDEATYRVGPAGAANTPVSMRL